MKISEKSSFKNLPPQAKPCHGFVLGSSSIQIQSKVPNTPSERNSNTANLLETHTRAGFLVSGGECWNTICHFFGMTLWTLWTLLHCFTALPPVSSKGRVSSNLRFRTIGIYHFKSRFGATPRFTMATHTHYLSIYILYTYTQSPRSRLADARHLPRWTIMFGKKFHVKILEDTMQHQLDSPVRHPTKFSANMWHVCLSCIPWYFVVVTKPILMPLSTSWMP